MLAAMTRPDARSIAARFAKHAREDDVPGLAAELAYRFLFALFPFALFVAALGSVAGASLGIQNPAETLVAALGDNLPPDIAQSVQPELEQLVRNAGPGLLTAGGLGFLWAAAGGTYALIKAMNRAYDVEDTRPMLHRIGLAIGLTILGGGGLLVSFVTIVGGAIVSEQVAERLGLSGPAWTFVWFLRWPATFALVVAAVAILFRLAPNIRPAWRWTIGGGVVFAVGWLLATWAFAFYVGTFGRYGATYGSLGAVIVVMLWFYLTALLLVTAAGVTAATAWVVDPEALQRRRDELARDLQLRRAAAGAQEAVTQSLDKVGRGLGLGSGRSDPAGPDEKREDGSIAGPGAQAGPGRDGEPGTNPGPDRRRDPERRVQHERRHGPRDRRSTTLNARPDEA